MAWKRTLWVVSIVVITMLAMTGCGPDYPKCDKDDHCQKSDQGQAEGRLYCVNGLCQQCRQDGDCGDASMECNAGVCEKIPGYCVSANDCPGNQACRDNRCGPECLSEADCEDGFECKGGSCVVKPECSADADCEGELVCRGGKCVDPPEPVACSLELVRFSYDSSALTDSARSSLQANARCIQERNLRVQVVGHADERGTSEYNIALGERRARAVRSYLTSLGVPGNRITTLSYGEERLLRNCGEDGPESCHQVNRRAETLER